MVVRCAKTCSFGCEDTKLVYKLLKLRLQSVVACWLLLVGCLLCCSQHLYSNLFFGGGIVFNIADSI